MYTDEEILRIRKKMQEHSQIVVEDEKIDKENEQSIFDGTIKVFDRDVTFERRELEKLGISILMPTDFDLLDEDLRRIVYPSANAPKFVYTSEEEYMNISFNQNNNIIKDENLKEFVDLSKRLLEVAGPKVKMVKSYVVEVEDRKHGVIEFISNAIDGVCYTCLGIVPHPTGVLLVPIAFKNNRKKRLIPIAKEVLQSIEII